MNSPYKTIKYFVALQALVICIVPQIISAQVAQKSGSDSDWTEVTRKTMPGVVSIVIYDSEGQRVSSGSGFIVQADGVVVTNHHVIRDARAGTKAIVVTKAGEKFEVKGVIAYDITKDFAIVRIPAVDLPSLRLGNSNNVEVGDGVLAIGDSLGILTGTVSTGIIRAKGREAFGSTWIQITAPVSHGNSGGPLINRAGEVIGVIQGGWVVGGDEGQNLNKAVPINFVRGSLQLGTTITSGLPQIAKEWTDLVNSQAEAKAKAQEEALKKIFTPYVDPDGVFAIKKPADWPVQRAVKRLDNGNTLIQTIFAPKGAALAELGGYLSQGLGVDVLIPPAGSQFGTDALSAGINQYAETLLRQNAGFELTNTGMFILNDLQAKVYKFEGKGPRVRESEKNVFYVFGNQKAIVQIAVVEPLSNVEFLEIINQYCAKSFELNAAFKGPGTSPLSDSSSGASQGTSTVTVRAVETAFKSGLVDDTIKLATAFLQTNANSPEANAYLGLALLAKKDVDHAVDFLEKSILLGQQISLPVRRLREPLLGHALENALVILSANGLVVNQGKTSFSTTYSSSSTSLTNYNNQCSLAYLQGVFTETSTSSQKTKTENKKFNMFPPNAGLQPVQQGQFTVNYAICDTQSLNTTAIVKLIARLSSRTP